MALGIACVPVLEACDGEDACQLHHPPYQQLDREERISRPRRDDSGSYDEECHCGIEAVVLHDLTAIPPQHTPLPQEG